MKLKISLNQLNPVWRAIRKQRDTLLGIQGLGDIKLKDIIARADGAAGDIVTWFKALPQEDQMAFALILKDRFGVVVKL